MREGGILREGFSEELDRLRQLRDHGADAIAALETRERERTGVQPTFISVKQPVP